MTTLDRDERRTLNRQTFLRMAAAALGGIAVTGCDVSSDRPSAEDSLDAFLDLSRVVTGVADLPRAVAPDYLEALEQAALPMTPSTLIQLAGYADGAGPSTLSELEASSALARRDGRTCASAIAAAWWSGMTPTRSGEMRVITYLDALVWRALPYAQPPSNCLGTTGSWAKAGDA